MRPALAGAIGIMYMQRNWIRSHYPVPLHMQKAYSSLNYGPEDFPIATRVADEVLSLPMFPKLTLEQQVRVSEQVLVFTSKLAPGTGGIETASLAVVGETA